MIPSLKPAFGSRELAAAVRPPRHDDVDRFERSFAERMGQRHAIAFAYGRTALAFALRARGLEPGEVICPAYTCAVVAHAIKIAGFEPVFVDSSDADFNMDLDLVEAGITDATRAIIATSLYGHPVDLDALDRIRQRHPNLMIVQDCAHSFAASWSGTPAQSAGDAAIYGLNISKIISSIFGGMITTDDDELATQVRERRDRELCPPPLSKSVRRLLYLAAVYPAFQPVLYGLVNRLERAGLLDRFTKYYDEAVIDMPADYLDGMTRLEARVGLCQVDRYDAIVAHRLETVEHYRSALADVEGVRLPPNVSGITASHFVVRMEDAEAVREAALRKGVQLGAVIEYVVPAMQVYRDCRFVDRGVARRFPEQVVNLPVHVGVSPRDRERVVQVLRDVAGTVPRRSAPEPS